MAASESQAREQYVEIRYPVRVLSVPETVEIVEIKAYGKRWFILFMFVWYASMNAYQWIEYCTITSIVVKYYNVSTILVDWTSIIYMALYPVLVIPASYINEKKGLRIAGLVGCFGTAFGTFIKVFSIAPNRFYIVLLGQSIVAASQTLILCLPPKIAATWFLADEVSTACSLGVFGTTLGVAFGYIVSPVMVKESDDPNVIAKDLKRLCWILTVIMIPVVISMYLYFPEEPAHRPSIAKVIERRKTPKFSMRTFYLSIKKLFRNKAFNIHCVAFSISIAVFSAVGTLFSQIIVYYFENAHKEAGVMGFLMVLAGLFGTVLFGLFLDKTKAYKETAIFIYALSGISVFSFAISLALRLKILVYCSVIGFGLALNSYNPVGLELAMELTFPSDESTTSGILTAISQFFGLVFTLGTDYLLLYVGPGWSIIILGRKLSLK